MRIILGGIFGKMGKCMLECCHGNPEYQIVGGFDLIKQESHCPVFDSPTLCKIKADVIIDFSTPQTTGKILDYCYASKTPILIATTGHSENELKNISALSAHTAVLLTGNTSFGAGVMRRCCTDIAQALKVEKPIHQIEITETHHCLKKDVPSGTALDIANSINMVYNEKKSVSVGRKQSFSNPSENEIVIHSIRGGSVVGKHRADFFFENERISIIHEAYDKKVFAWGALFLAEKLIKHKNGLYTADTV